MRVIDKYNKKKDIEILWEEDVVLIDDKVYVVTDFWKNLKLCMHYEYRLFCLNDGKINDDLTIIEFGKTLSSSIYFEKIEYNMFLGDIIYDIKPTDLNGGDVFLYNNSIFIRTNKKGEFDRPCLYYIEALEYETKKVVSFRIEPYAKIVQYYPNAYAEVIRNDKR